MNQIQKLINEGETLCKRELNSTDNPIEMKRLLEIRSELKELTIDKRRKPNTFSDRGIQRTQYFPKPKYSELWSEWEF